MLDLLAHYGVGAVERERLLALAEQASRPGWWRRYSDILPDWFATYVAMEEAATSICMYEPQVVPGLLQTPRYTAAVSSVYGVPVGEAARHVVFCQQRQRRFAEGRTKLWAVLEETALRRPFGGTQTLRDQLCYLLSLSAKPDLTLQIIPAATAAHVEPGGFTLLRFAEPDLTDVVYLKHLTGASCFGKKADVDRYVGTMHQLAAAGAEPAQTPRILTTIIGELDAEPDAGR